MKLPDWPKHFPTHKINYNKNKLSHVLEALELLGNPHKKLSPTIHIAGTNGKGSTLTFLSSILKEAGYSYHSYTSPHLIEFNERICISSKNISDEFLTEILRECEEKTKSVNLTFFEGTTLAALVAFSRIPADFLLLETGMGGKYDATNVVKDALLTIITSISYDHTEFLGTNIEAITEQKAGIIKKNSYNITAKQSFEEALPVIDMECNQLSTQNIVYGKDYSVNEDKYFISKSRKLLLPEKLGIKGKYQYYNASNAIAAIEVLESFSQVKVTDENILQGLEKAFWPARMQLLSKGNLHKKLQRQDLNIYVDGSHNPEGIIALSESFEDIMQNSKNICVIAILEGKDSHHMLLNFANILEKFDQIYTVNFSSDFKNSIPSEELARELQQIIKTPVISCKDIDTCLKEINKENDNKDPTNILFCGSLYFAGIVLEEHKKNF